MPPLVFLLAFLYAGLYSTSSSNEIETELLIRNVKDSRGDFVISFYDNEGAFPKVGREMLIEKVQVTDTLPHLIKVKVPKEGWYAIAMFQDEDSNGKIKQDKVGIPEEPYAFSNNIHPKVAAPTFALCKFYISKSAAKPQEIRLIQPRFGMRH